MGSFAVFFLGLARSAYRRSAATQERSRRYLDRRCPKADTTRLKSTDTDSASLTCRGTKWYCIQLAPPVSSATGIELALPTDRNPDQLRNTESEALKDRAILATRQFSKRPETQTTSKTNSSIPGLVEGDVANEDDKEV